MLNEIQKTVIKAQLEDEKAALNELKDCYEQAKTNCEKQIAALNARKDMQNLQTIIYQKKYQDAILKQIEKTLDELNNNQYKTLSEFFKSSYVTGYVGSMYDLYNQNIPLTVAIDPKKMIKAIQTDSKLSESYYRNRKQSEDIVVLKKTIRLGVTRGIASGENWVEVAYEIAEKMNSPFNKAMHDAMRIVRTEGHRINQEGFLDAGAEAKEHGADIVKQWDSTLDKVTRQWHQEADGQIVEWDKDFIVGGEHMKAPGVGGSARNVCNCRCQLLQRAKWALDDSELKTLEERAKFFELDKSDSFEDFKKKYLKLPKNADTMKIEALHKPKQSRDLYYNKLFEKLNQINVDYNSVQNQIKKMTEKEIINYVAMNDKTSGSCASVGLAYIGQKQGWAVLDFRGGKSQEFFSNSINLYILSKTNGIKILNADGGSSIIVGNRLLKQVEIGKEYYLCVGRHASIIRKTKKENFQYLELQSLNNNGWVDFNENPKYTLHERFGCTSKPDHGASSQYDFMIDIKESNFLTDDFKYLLGYINTVDYAQKKGKNETIKQMV